MMPIFYQAIEKNFYSHSIRGKDVIYLCGNSLGLRPKNAIEYFVQELNDWAEYGVEGHFQSKRPWFSYHHFFTKSLATLVGAKETEGIAINTLTVNLPLLMLSFYRPKQRYKIIFMEAGAFPSDMYAVETQVKMHGLQYHEEAIIEIAPRKGEHCIAIEDIEEAIKKNKNKVALVLFGGVNYYTGQYFDIKQIVELAHSVGAYAGFDLAHAVGNKVLHLHDWKVDFTAGVRINILTPSTDYVTTEILCQENMQKTNIKKF